jgi:hypothetical protein
VMKKVMQKALRQCVKKLGMKYDQDVHSTAFLLFKHCLLS